MRWGLGLGLLLGGLAIAGCGASSMGIAKQRFANEFNCDVGRTSAVALGAGGYRVRGCGDVATYNCATGAYSGTVCVLQNSEARPSTTEAAPLPVAGRASQWGRVSIGGSTRTALRLQLRSYPVVLARADADTFRMRIDVASAANIRACENAPVSLVMADRGVVRAAAAGSSMTYSLPAAALRELASGGQGGGVRLCGEVVYLSGGDRQDLEVLTSEGAADPADAPPPFTPPPD